MAELHFPFVVGADESRNAKLTALPRLRRAENLRFAERDTLRKRFGTGVYASGTPDSGQSTPVGPVRLARHEGPTGAQTLVLAEDSLWTVAANGARLEEVDILPRTTLEGLDALGHYGAADVVAAGSAQTTAFRVWGWVTYDGTDYILHLQTVDIETGAGSAATVIPLANASTATQNLKLIAIGSKVTAFWGESTGTIRYLDITSASAGPYTTTQGTTLVTGSSAATQWFDVSPHSTGYCIAYRTAANTITVSRRTSAHVSSASSTHTAPGTTWHCAIQGDVSSMCLLVGSDSATEALKFFWLDANCTARSSDGYTPGQAGLQVGGSLNEVCIAAHSGLSSTGVAFGFNGTAVSTGNRLCRLGATSEGGGDITLTDRQGQSLIASKPWVYRDDVYCLVRYYQSQANSYYAVVRHSTAGTSNRGIAHPYLEAYLRGQRAPGPSDYAQEPCVGVAFDGEQAHVAVVALDRYSPPDALTDPTGDTAVDQDETTATGNQVVSVFGVDGYSFSHASRSRWGHVQVGQYTAFAGGVLTVFDGRRASEVGFASFPEPASGVTVQSTGGSVAEGVYLHGSVWEYVDYLGNRAQSPVKVIGSTMNVGAGSGRFTITGPYPIPHTYRHWMLDGDDDRRVTWALYTTDTDDEVLQRLDGTTVAAFVENALNSNTASNLDDYSDTYDRDAISITSRELLYTTQYGAGELPNMMTPPTNIVAAHEGRICFVDAENPTSVGYTKILFPGAAPAWNAALRIQFEVPIVALASQDGNLVAFSLTRIYTVTGVGLDNTGATGGYNAPQMLSGHVGCVNRRSVVSTPIGTFFESTRGIELLERGGSSPKYIGEGVRDTLASFPIITSSLHVPARSEVWFACVDTETVASSPTGRVLVWDYRVQTWFVRNYQGKPVADMVLEDGDTAVAGAGRVVFGIYDDANDLTLWREDSGFDDADGSFVSWLLRTGDIRYANGLGRHSVRRISLLGECVEGEAINVRESTDSGDTWTIVKSMSVATEQDMKRGWQSRKRKSAAHAYEIYSSQSSAADSEGVALTALTIEGNPLRGATSLSQMERT